MGSPRGHSLLQRHPPAPAGDPPQATGGYLLHCGPQWAAGDSLTHNGLHYGLQGNLCFLHEAPPPPPSSLTLVSAELFLSHILTPPFQQIFPLLKYVITEVLPPITDWLDLRQWRVCLSAGWHWLYQTWRKLLAASHRSHPCSPSATKTLPRKPHTD